MSSAFTEQIVTSIAMPDGTILYRSVEVQSTGGQKVLDFRYGSWVEKLKTDSEKITADKQRAEHYHYDVRRLKYGAADARLKQIENNQACAQKQIALRLKVVASQSTTK